MERSVVSVADAVGVLPIEALPKVSATVVLPVRGRPTGWLGLADRTRSTDRSAEVRGLGPGDAGVMTQRMQDIVLVAVLAGIAGLAGVIMLLVISTGGGG
ncbi:hypothetical protein [Saccharopolyspora spinosa]|uniref:Uncharacterized protein n=1 Tax=Saccharopolyspora spinosa TaxID=60894 RepID=A0A2N3XRQ6_SACSN|nr:hypothetical protein A8926_0865 [Saccharopolyspora spinosa]